MSIFNQPKDEQKIKELMEIQNGLLEQRVKFSELDFNKYIGFGLYHEAQFESDYSLRFSENMKTVHKSNCINFVIQPLELSSSVNYFMPGTPEEKYSALLVTKTAHLSYSHEIVFKPKTGLMNYLKKNQIISGQPELDELEFLNDSAALEFHTIKEPILKFYNPNEFVCPLDSKTYEFLLSLKK